MQSYFAHMQPRGLWKLSTYLCKYYYTSLPAHRMAWFGWYSSRWRLRGQVISLPPHGHHHGSMTVILLIEGPCGHAQSSPGSSNAILDQLPPCYSMSLWVTKYGEGLVEWGSKWPCLAGSSSAILDQPLPGYCKSLWAAKYGEGLVASSLVPRFPPTFIIHYTKGCCTVSKW